MKLQFQSIPLWKLTEKEMSQRALPVCFFLHKSPWRYDFLSFECIKLSKSINTVMFYIDSESSFMK